LSEEENVYLENYAALSKQMYKIDFHEEKQRFKNEVLIFAGERHVLKLVVTDFNVKLTLDTLLHNYKEYFYFLTYRY
jgi:hypothetical protein